MRNIRWALGRMRSVRTCSRCQPHPLLLLTLLLGCTLFLPTLALARQEAPLARWHNFTAENGLAGNIVQSIWQDPYGQLWFGTENGVSRYDGRNWITYRSTNGLPDNNVWSISGDADSVWFATSSGVSVFQGGRWTNYAQDDGLPGNDVRAILVSADGTVWAGTFGGGIGRLRPGASRWETFELPPRLRGVGSFVQSIWQSPANEIWFSTNSTGALRLRGEQITQFSFRTGSRNTVWAVGGEREEQSTWLATFRGVVQVNPDDSVRIIDEMVQGVALSSTEVLAVAGGATNDLWFGTRAAGVFHRHDGRWERFTTASGLGSNYVQSILVDRSGRVWFGTRGGGVTLLDRQALRLETLDPVVTVTDIRSNSSFGLDNAVLNAHQNNLQFTFTIAAPWLPPQDVGVRYWLEQEGQTAKPLPSIARSDPATVIRATSSAFIDLPPGNYILHVVPLVGAISGSERQYPFTIRSAPPIFNAETIAVEVDRQAVEQGWALPPHIFDDTRQVQLDFRASDDTSRNEELRYFYRQSDDPIWHAANGSSATIALPPGQHQIEVYVLDADGNRSATVTVSVIVPTPLWTMLLLYLALILVPSGISATIGALGYRRWMRRQALRRAVSGYLIPYDVGPLITVPDRYIGRQHVLDTILGKIANNSFYIWGEKRIGKTSLLLQLKQRLLQRNDIQTAQYLIPVFRNIQDLPQQQFWLYLIRSIVAELPTAPEHLAAYASADSGYDDLDAENDLEAIIAHVQDNVAPRQPCIILLLDEVDTLQRYDSNIRQRFRAFCQHTQRHLRVVLAGVYPPRGEASDTSPWYNIFEPVMLGPLAQPDTLVLIRHYNHNPYRYTAEAEQAIVRMGDGKPFDTQWLCSEAVKAMLAEQRNVVSYSDVEHAVAVVLRARSSDYAASWQILPSNVQATLHHAQHNGGIVAYAQDKTGPIERLVDAGLVLKTANGYRLTRLFQSWLEWNI